MIRKKLISLALLLALALSCFSPSVYAGDQTTRRIIVSYAVDTDERFGAPGLLDPDAAELPGTKYPLMGEKFVLADPLESDSNIAVDEQTGDVYLGRWEFSGWVVPFHVLAYEELSDPLISSAENYTAPVPETKKKIICCSILDAVFKGSWVFVPEEKLQIPDKLGTEDKSPLPYAGEALSEFWPERVQELNKVYETGAFADSVVSFMNENVQQIPLQSREFASVEISEMERVKFMKALKETYDALISDTNDSCFVRSELESLLSDPTAPYADISTAFVVCCADRAGLLEGKSRSMLKTADLSLLYDFLINDASADVITTEQLLQLYGSGEERASEELRYLNRTVDFASEENWYDVTKGKSSLLPGDLVVYKNGYDTPVSIGIIDSVQNDSFTYVICNSSGSPSEVTLDKSEIERMSSMGTAVEVIGLRICDVARIIYEFLINEVGLPKASALGVLGNIYYESGFSTTAMGDGYTSFGLCQWHEERFLNLVIFCMENNYNIASLEGQLRFLASELTEYFPALQEGLIQDAGLGKSWTREAAYRFCRLFEQPAELELNCALRGAVASGPAWKDFNELFLTQEHLQNMSLSQGTGVPEQEIKSDFIYYTVKEGDTLVSICNSFGFSYAENRQEVNTLNNLTNENIIVVGQTLIFWRTMIPYYQ